VDYPKKSLNGRPFARNIKDRFSHKSFLILTPSWSFLMSNQHRSGGPRHGQRPSHHGYNHRRGGGGGRHYRDRDDRKKASPFFSKVSVDPFQRVRLETGAENILGRVIDIVTPIGKGQRGLIVSPPKAGKTTIIQEICRSASKNHPEMKVYALLVDERPEEVTDFKRSVPCEVFASSSDQDNDSHIGIAKTALDRCIQEADSGQDVLLVCDSLTRLARAHNRNVSSGKVMSGGVDAEAMQIPKKFFGAARKVEEGGSLTIIATVLIETGSRMDDLIFQEFKGTGNMELVLSRLASERRVFPAIDVNASGTRKEEKLLEDYEMTGIKNLRRKLAGLQTVDATEQLIYLVRQTPTNKELLGIASKV